MKNTKINLINNALTRKKSGINFSRWTPIWMAPEQQLQNKLKLIQSIAVIRGMY